MPGIRFLTKKEYTFVVLQFFRIILCWLLLVSITLGYAGIPMHKMICNVDGHTEIALFGKADSCIHENKIPSRKSCCESETSADQPGDCCDFEHTYNKIDTDAQTHRDTYFNTTVSIQDTVSTIETCFVCSLTITHTLPAKAPPPRFHYSSDALAYLMVFRV